MAHGFTLTQSLIAGSNLNPDKLALNLQFASDRSFSKPSSLAASETQIKSRTGPSPVFVRASSATEVGSAGLVQYAPENLYYPSELLNSAILNVSLNRVSGDSTILSPVFISETTDGTSQIHRAVANGNVNTGFTICSYILKQNGRNFVYFNGSGGHPSNTIDLSNGLFTNSSGWSSVSLGNGWYKVITPVFTSTGASLCSIQLNSDSSVTDTYYIGDTTKGVLFGGCQKERSSISRQYLPTTSSPVYGPRFEYDPSSLTCKGLLVEDARTNSLYDSNVFTSGSASNSFSSNGFIGSITSGDSPFDYDKSYRKFTDPALSAATRHGEFYTVSPSLGTTKYTVSIFLKNEVGNGLCRIALAADSSNFGGFNINIATGAVGGAFNIGSANASTAKVIPYPNGWYRISLTLTINPNYFVLCFVNTINDVAGLDMGFVSYVNGVSDRSIKAFGMQLETGAFPTSYIPTSGGTAARSSDVCSIMGSSFSRMYNQSSGTIQESFESSPNTSTSYIAISDGNVTRNSIRFNNDTGNISATYYSNSAAVSILNTGTIGTSGTMNNIASSYSSGGQSAVRNGGTVFTGTGALPTGNLTQMNIGSDERSGTPNAYYINKCIKSLKYYKNRFTDANLKTLST